MFVICLYNGYIHKTIFSEYYHYNDFLDAVDAYELDLEDNRIKTAADIVKKVSHLRFIQNFTLSYIVISFANQIKFGADNKTWILL